MGTNSAANRRYDRRIENRTRMFRERDEVDPKDIDPQMLAHAVKAILAVGGALRVGRSRDYSVWNIGIYGDGKIPYTEWVQASEDINQYFYELGEWFDQVAPDGQGDRARATKA